MRGNSLRAEGMEAVCDGTEDRSEVGYEKYSEKDKETVICGGAGAGGIYDNAGGGIVCCVKEGAGAGKRERDGEHRRAGK